MYRVFHIIANWKARRALQKLPGIDIADGARVIFSKIVPKAGCRLTVGSNSMIDGKLIFDREGANIQIGERVFIGV
ncbi:MAG: hypothetical protein P8047_15850, partial [Gammaproteobacteria bacterium]